MEANQRGFTGTALTLYRPVESVTLTKSADFAGLWSITDLPCRAVGYNASPLPGLSHYGDRWRYLAHSVAKAASSG